MSNIRGLDDPLSNPKLNDPLPTLTETDDPLSNELPPNDPPTDDPLSNDSSTATDNSLSHYRPTDDQGDPLSRKPVSRATPLSPPRSRAKTAVARETANDPQSRESVDPPSNGDPPSGMARPRRIGWGSFFGAVVGGGIALTLTAVAAPIVLPAIGFGTGGVVAGSMAAATQSAIGNVAAGSLFATLQSLGAAGGLSVAATGAATAAGAAAGAGVGAGGAAISAAVSGGSRYVAILVIG